MYKQTNKTGDILLGSVMGNLKYICEMSAIHLCFRRNVKLKVLINIGPHAFFYKVLHLNTTSIFITKTDRYYVT